MKRLIAMLICVNLLSGVCVEARTEMKEYAPLEDIAAKNISVTTILTPENGEVLKYSNMLAFVEEAKKEKIYSEYDIACFLVDYTGLDYRALPEEDIYDYLEIDEMYSSNTSFENVQETEIMPSAIWDSPDGMMTITTNYTYLETLNNGVDSYKVYAMAKWLEYPRFRLNDCLAIGHNANYDDDIEVTGKVTFEIYCDLCDLSRYDVCEVDTANPEDGFAELKFQTMAPSLHFDLPNDKCEECLFEQNVYFVAFLRYGILVDTVANIQAGYAHKLVGVGQPSVGIDINGTPSFGTTLGMQIEEYIAEPVTVMID